MMFEEFEGFSGIFGEDVFASLPVMTDEPKKETKKKKGKAKSTGKAKKKETAYQAPLHIVFDSIGAIDLEEGTYTKEQLIQKIGEVSGFSVFSEKTVGSFLLKELKKGTIYITPNYISKVSKGSSAEKLLLGEEIELGSVMDNEDTSSFSADRVITYIQETYHMDVELHLIGNTYIPVGRSKKTGLLVNLKFPIILRALTLLNECLEIGEEDYQTMTEATSFSEENEGEDTEEAGNDKISENVIESYLKTLFPDYSEDLAYAVNEDDNSIQIQHKDVFGNTTSTPGAKKETTYPTDATISLVFTKLELTPALFDGKKEVTAKDIIRYLGKKYPEYSPERTELQYDQKRKLIMPILKSGKRGYDLQDTEEYRLEDSPIMKVRANKYGEKFLGCVPGDFQFHLPKIPFSVLKEIMGFFWDVYVFQRTEAIAQIYYDLVSETYEIYIPEQTASPSDVEFQRNTAMEHDEGKLLVMEIHSHGSYSPVWSETDNQDEISHRLYCVVGNLQDFRYDPSHIRVRAATGGLHVLVNPDLVFAFPETLVDFNPDLIKVNVIRDEREKRLAKFRFCDRTFEVYGSYVVSENNDDYGVTYQYPEFVSLSAKESVDGNMFDFVPSGRTWSGHKVTVDDMITGLLDSQIRKDDSYTVLYMECGLKNIISSYHDDITLSANGIDIPKRVLHRENCYNLLLVTNENIYYHYDENVLLLDKNHSVISDNYFAEVGLDQSLEAIQEGREELLFDSREGEG